MSFKKSFSIFSEHSLSLVFIFMFVWFNFTLLVFHPIGGSYNANSWFTILFVNIMLLIVILLPLINYFLDLLGNDRVESFLALPEKGVKITYLIFYDYLSGIALSAFLFAVFIFSNKFIFSYYGVWFSVAYSVFMYVASIFIAVISLVRFILPFRKFSNTVYTLVIASTSLATWLLVKVAILMTNISS